jgi:hypothetical protein
MIIIIVAGYSNSTNGDVTANHGGDDYWIVKLSPAVGIHELSENENPFIIYPNPSTNQFTISFSPDLIGAMSNASLKIFNMMGEEVYSGTLNGRQETINTNFSAGLYFVQVKDTERQWVQKIVVE